MRRFLLTIVSIPIVIVLAILGMGFGIYLMYDISKQAFVNAWNDDEMSARQFVKDIWYKL